MLADLIIFLTTRKRILLLSYTLGPKKGKTVPLINGIWPAAAVIASPGF